MVPRPPCLLRLKDRQPLHSTKMYTGVFVSLDTGKLMARYCLAFESIKLFLGLQGNEDLNDLVGMSILISFCQCFELPSCYNAILYYFIFYCWTVKQDIPNGTSGNGTRSPMRGTLPFLQINEITKLLLLYCNQ
jgi:hypothetical protein